MFSLISCCSLVVDWFAGKVLITSNLSSLRELILFIQEEPKKTKDLMYSSTSVYIELSLRLFPVYIAESGIVYL